jgi:hypothetical protein
MTFTFIYTRHKLAKNCDTYHTDWYLLLDTKDSLMAYLEARNKQMLRSYWGMKKQPCRAGHYPTYEQNIIDTVMYLTNRKSIVDDAAVLDRFLSGYIKVFQLYGKVLINKNNGCRHMDDTFVILKTEQRNGIIFPTEALTEKDIIVAQWEGCKHWYVRVGNFDLPGRWFSYKEGMDAGRRYLNTDKSTPH